jgi:hypothetical protein
MSAGCTQDEVLKAMGLTWKDLMGARPALSKEASARLQDEQTLHALRDLTSFRSQAAMTALTGYNPYPVLTLRHSLRKRIVALENRLDPRLKAIRERDLKTARFVKRWGWDKLWDLYAVSSMTQGGLA